MMALFLLLSSVLVVEGQIAAGDLAAKIKKARWELGKVHLINHLFWRAVVTLLAEVYDIYLFCHHTSTWRSGRIHVFYNFQVPRRKHACIELSNGQIWTMQSLGNGSHGTEAYRIGAGMHQNTICAVVVMHKVLLLFNCFAVTWSSGMDAATGCP